MMLTRRAGTAALIALGLCLTGRAAAQEREPSRADILRGEYGQYRANNDLRHYHLDIRIDPSEKSIVGKTVARFRMLQEDSRIQLDLYENLQVDRIVWNGSELAYEREFNAIFVDFPQPQASGEELTLEVHYSGKPRAAGRFGGITFGEDPHGRPWVYTACEGEGSSIWWPSKDQWRDEPDEGVDISVAVPNGLTNVSNGRFQGSEDLGDGYTRWNYRVHYPINSYNVSINVGTYEHFGEMLGDLTLDYYVQPEDIDKARRQFAQVTPMLQAFIHYFGEYPFAKDGYKLIQVPYTGMEHQSAVTYGNGFTNGYYNRDWTGVGVSMKFDFIIIHETGHEWFGNAVSAADVSDMWIQEGWTTYLECMYVEQVFGADDALRYTNGYKDKVQNRRPVITERGLHQTPSQDMYFKGCLFLHTLRGVMDDDDRWWALVRETYDTFKYRNIMTEDMIELFNRRFERDLTPIFRQYLWQSDLPILLLDFEREPGRLSYRWHTAEADFAMPINIGDPSHWTRIEATNEWQSMETAWDRNSVQVDTDHFYVEVKRRQ